MSAVFEEPPMFDQAGMVLVPAARHTDPETSHAAAESVRNITATHERILEILERFGEGTDEDIAAYYQDLAELFDWPPVSPSGLRSRRAELVFWGRVVDTGRRGKTRSGRASIIWERPDRP